MMWKVFLPVLLAVLTGCHSKPKAQLTLAQMIGEGHGLNNWHSMTALAGDVHIEFAEEGILDAHFTYDLKTGKTRMQLADQSILVYEGQKVWVSPANSKVANARNILRTWPMLVILPQRLQDSQVTWEPTQTAELAGQNIPAARVRFPAWMTDAPDQWYMVYADTKYHRLQGVLYPPKPGDERRQAITFYDYRDVDGMIFATEWRFWQWNPAVGIFGKPIGTARIYNLEFIEPKPNAYTPPANSRQELPATR